MRTLSFEQVGKTGLDRYGLGVGYGVLFHSISSFFGFRNSEHMGFWGLYFGRVD